MSRHIIIKLMLLFFAASVIGCGGGSSGSSGDGQADFASITVDGAGPTVYTEATSTISPSGYFPYLTASVPGGTTGTYLFSLDWNASTLNYDTRFEIHTPGSTAGTYSINGDNAMVLFAPEGGPTYSSLPGQLAYGVTGTVNITEVGPVGGKVKGNFDVVSLVVSTSITGTTHVTGSFSITRD